MGDTSSVGYVAVTLSLKSVDIEVHYRKLICTKVAIINKRINNPPYRQTILDLVHKCANCQKVTELRYVNCFD